MTGISNTQFRTQKCREYYNNYFKSNNYPVNNDYTR